MAPLRASNVCDDGNFSSPKECALAPVPDRMLAHAARAKGACDDFSVCRAFWSFWAPKGHDITTTKRIYDCRLRVSCIKEYKRLFNVLSVLKRYSPYSLQVNPKGPKSPAHGKIVTSALCSCRMSEHSVGHLLATHGFRLFCRVLRTLICAAI